MSEHKCVRCGQTDPTKLTAGAPRCLSAFGCIDYLKEQRDRLAAALRALVRHDWLADEREGRPSCAELLEAMETLRVVAPEVPP